MRFSVGTSHLKNSRKIIFQSPYIFLILLCLLTFLRKASLKIIMLKSNKEKIFYRHYYDNGKSNNHSENIESFGIKPSNK